MLLDSSFLFVAFVQFVVQALVPPNGQARPIGDICGSKIRRGEQLPCSFAAPLRENPRCFHQVGTARTVVHHLFCKSDRLVFAVA